MNEVMPDFDHWQIHKDLVFILILLTTIPEHHKNPSLPNLKQSPDAKGAV